MLVIGKYQEENKEATYSEEGFTGGLAGWLVGGALWPTGFGSAAAAGAAHASIQKTREDIEEISDRIAKLRNKQIDDAVRQGIKLPKDIKHLDKTQVVTSALLGVFFGPFWGAALGSTIQNDNEKLEAKIKILIKELKDAGIDPYGK